MKKNQSKSLSILIVFCLLLTGMFNTVAALPQSEGTKIADEHDGHTHVDAELLEGEVQIEPTSEESLRIIEDPLEPPIDPPGPAYCSHNWRYYDMGFSHKKYCLFCDAVEYQKHTKVYISQGAHYHSERCQYCSFNLLTPHIESGVFISDGGNGHHQNCGKCGAPCATLQHTLMYLNNGTTHNKKCMSCSYYTNESHNFGPWIPGGMSHERRCNLCNALQVKSHSLKYYSTGADYHSKVCTVCGYAGQDIHNYSVTNVGTDDHTLKCSKCNQHKTEPHNFTYTSQGLENHVKGCTCGYSTTQSHTWDSENQQCTQCGQEACQHNNTNAINTNDDFYHRLECNDCNQSNVGNETHDWKLTYILPTLPGLDPVKQYVCTECDYKLSPGATPR